MAADLAFFIRAINATRAGLAAAVRGIRAFSTRALSVFRNFARVVKVAMIAATAAVVGFGVHAVNSASDAIESASKFRTVFKGLEQQAQSAASTLADSFGLASDEARMLLGDVGDILTGFGFTTKEALNLSFQVNKLAVDLASFTNFAGGARGASAALTKALLGEAESVKALGIVIRQDTAEYQKLIKSIQRTNKVGLVQAKALAALRIATTQSKNAIGDFARTQNDFANVTRVTRSEFRNLTVEIGRQLIEGLRLVDFFKDLRDRFKLWTTELKQSKAVQAWAERTRKALGQVQEVIKAIFEGGEKRKIAFEGLKTLGANIGRNIVSKILEFAPVMGHLIGKAARNAFLNIGAGIGTRIATGKEATKELERFGELKKRGIFGVAERIGGLFGGGAIGERSREFQRLARVQAGQTEARAFLGQESFQVWNTMVEELKKQTKAVEDLKNVR